MSSGEVVNWTFNPKGTYRLTRRAREEHQSHAFCVCNKMSEPVKRLLSRIEGNMSNLRVLSQGCQQLGERLGAQNLSWTEIDMNSLVSTLVQASRSHSHDALIQLTVCNALRHAMSAPTFESQNPATKEACLDLILDVMHNHRSHADLNAKFLLHILDNMIRSKTIVRASKRKACAQALVAVMDANPRNTFIQKNGIKMIVGVLTMNKENVSEILESDAIGSALRAMREHPQQLTIQVFGIMMLDDLLPYGQQAIDEMLRLGAFSVLLAAMDVISRVDILPLDDGLKLTSKTCLAKLFETIVKMFARCAGW